MIIKDSEAAIRLASPMNLINQLRCGFGNGNNHNNNNDKKSNAMSLFGIGRKSETATVTETVTTSNRSTVNSERSELGDKSFNPFQTKNSSESKTPQQAPLLKTVEQIERPATKLDEILENHESQIKLGLAHDSALKLLGDSVALLSTKLEDVKTDKLPAVVTAASKVVESIRRERNEASKNNKDREVHYHFYTPQQRTIDEYKVIDVSPIVTG